MRRIYTSILAAGAVLAVALPAAAAYKPTPHRTKLAEGEIAVTAPGRLDQAGKTYVLMNHITSPTTALFVANNVTLDLNGYTITYSAGQYEHVPNYSFEKGLAGWDTSNAPGAEVADTSLLHPMHGRMTCKLPKGQELASPFINLPVADRTYYAMVMVADPKQHVTISVDDQDLNPVRCEFPFGGTPRVTCPTVAQPPKGGGGTVYALIYGMPAGKYRIRVKAVDSDAIIDAVDIRPAMDVGVGIVDQVIPWAYYKCVIDGDTPPAFFDYLKEGSFSEPVAGIPRVTEAGKVTIKNGVIRSGFRGIGTTGILSTARKTKTVVKNVKLISKGINANAISVFEGVLRDCRIEVDAPFIIDHTRLDQVAVSLKGAGKSVVTRCEFYGGQGCLMITGKGGSVHGNLFAGRQTVPGHYSLSLQVRNFKVYNNRFVPKRGSGMYLFRSRNVKVYNNTFRITASPPSNDHSRRDHPTNAIRISDHNDRKGSRRGSKNIRIYRNKFRITGRPYEGTHKDYLSVVSALSVNVGGGSTYVYDNDIVVDHKDPANRDAEAYAINIGGSNIGGVYYNNKITANVTPIWIASRHGQAKRVKMYSNTVIKAEGAEDFVPIILGSHAGPAKKTAFYSNLFEGIDFGVTIAQEGSEYEFGWTLTIRTDPGAEVTIMDANGKVVLAGKADSKGLAVARLAEYKVVTGWETQDKIDLSTYTVKVGDQSRQVTMTSDQVIAMNKAGP